MGLVLTDVDSVYLYKINVILS